MTDDVLSNQVKEFIASSIDSVSQLETLLLLQTNRQQEWTAEALARELRIEPTGAANELNQLAARKLLTAIPGNPLKYRYSPQNETLDAAVVGLAQAYLVRRVTVISLIFSKPTDKLRVFADAFRIRKENPDE